MGTRCLPILQTFGRVVVVEHLPDVLLFHVRKDRHVPGDLLSALGSALGDILDKESPSGALTAQKMAKEFDSCLQTFLSVNQTTIITTAGLPGLISELADLLGKENASATLFCQGFATAVNNHAMAAIVSGMIPGAPPIPFTGPIS